MRHAFVAFAPLPLKVKDEFETRYGVRLIEKITGSPGDSVRDRPLSKRSFAAAISTVRVMLAKALPGVGLCAS